MTVTKDEFITRLGKIVENSDRMLLVINERIEVLAPFFNCEDIQKFTYLLSRTSCEWWIYPADGNGQSVKLVVRLF